MPSQPDLVPVGKVGRPHGIDGSFFVEGPSDRPERFARGATLYVNGEPAEVVVSKRGSAARPVIKLDRHVERGTTLAVPREALPALEEDEYYSFQLVGLTVEEEGGRLLGPMERLVILGLGLAGDYTAAGIVVAAKGLLRFPELQAARKEPTIAAVTEYFLVGSFTSWLLALGGIGLVVATR